MSATRRGTLHSPVLWFTMDRGTAGGRQCRDYTVADEGGRQLLRARAFNWSRDIVLADSDGTLIIMIRRSRIFALSGRAVVLEFPAQRPIGEVGRSGRFSDSTGQMSGRFRDARAARERARESVFQAAAEALLARKSGRTKIARRTVTRAPVTTFVSIVRRTLDCDDRVRSF